MGDRLPHPITTSIAAHLHDDRLQVLRLSAAATQVLGLANELGSKFGIAPVDILILATAASRGDV